MLDKKDQIIFENLLHDCRISESKLAKLSKLTQPAIHYRIQRLEKNKYIDKYDIIIDYTFFETNTHFYFVPIPQNQKKDFENYCKSNKGIVSLISLIDKQNFFIMTMMHQKEQSKFDKYISKFNYSKYNLNDLNILPFSIFSNTISTKKIIKRKKVKLDDIDKKIILNLSNGGGRKPLLKTCTELNLTWDIVKYRFKKLSDAGVFAMFIAQPNPNTFSLQNDILLIKTKSAKSELQSILIKLGKFTYLVELENNLFLTQLLSTSFIEFKEILSKLHSDSKEKLVDVKIYPTEKNIFLNRYNIKNI